MEKNKSKGLGDDIAKITKITGIDELSKRLANLMGKEDCGCDKRQEIVNNWVPYDKENKKNKKSE